MSASKRAELGQIVIRPPEGMRERIKALAERNHRSMNAEIISALESWLAEADYHEYQLAELARNPPDLPKEGDAIIDPWFSPDEPHIDFVSSREDIERVVKRLAQTTADNLRREMLKWLSVKPGQDSE